jgi:peptide/nickel transport system substrate-binding protein
LVVSAWVIAATPALAQDVVRVGVTTLPPSLFNPFRYTGLPAQYTWSAVFDGLTTFDESGALKPHLAVSWENVDPVTWIFRLRPDVTFSNGAPFTAEAVVTAVAFLTGPEAQGEAVATMMRFLRSARAIDTHTVEIKTTAPTPMLPRYMTQLYAVEPTTFRKAGLEGFARAPVATGPFVVQRIQPEKVTFTANRTSWRAPKVGALEIRALADQPSRALAVQSRQIDIALQLGPEDVGGIVAAGGRKVAWRDPQVWSYHFVPGRVKATEDVRVREALNLAIDRVSIIDRLLDRSTVPATQPAPPDVYGYNPDLPPIPYDPARARTLLAEAGWPKGFSIVLEATSGSGPNDDLVNLTVAQQLQDIGVQVEIRRVSSNQLIANSFDGKWKGDAFAIAYSFAPTLEALRALDRHSCLNPQAWYCNPGVMPLVQAAQTEFEPGRNLKLRHEIMAFYRKDWASIFMFQQPRFAGTSGRISGLKVINNQISYDEIALQGGS